MSFSPFISTPLSGKLLAIASKYFYFRYSVKIAQWLCFLKITDQITIFLGNRYTETIHIKGRIFNRIYQRTIRKIFLVTNIKAGSYRSCGLKRRRHKDTSYFFIPNSSGDFFTSNSISLKR